MTGYADVELAMTQLGGVSGAWFERARAGGAWRTILVVAVEGGTSPDHLAQTRLNEIAEAVDDAVGGRLVIQEIRIVPRAIYLRRP